MTYWSAQARAYAGPSAASIRSQNSVCLTAWRLRRATERRWSSRASNEPDKSRPQPRADVPPVVDDVVQVVDRDRRHREPAAVAAQSRSRPFVGGHRRVGVRDPVRGLHQFLGDHGGMLRGVVARPPRWRLDPSSGRAVRPRSSISRTLPSNIRCTSRTWQPYSSTDHTAGFDRSRTEGADRRRTQSAASRRMAAATSSVRVAAASKPHSSQGRSRTHVQSFVSGSDRARARRSRRSRMIRVRRAARILPISRE